jgi:hypothetical protein
LSDGQETLDWGALAPLFVHRDKLLIMEAMQWIDCPLSASELERVLGSKLVTSTISYHLTSLARCGVLRPIEKQKGLRAKEKRPFVLSLAVKK